MAIKFEKIQPGMELMDIHRHRMGNTMMTELGLWPVRIISVDAENRTAIVSWNGNRPEKWNAHDLVKLYAKEPPSYLKQQERKRARSAR